MEAEPPVEEGIISPVSLRSKDFMYPSEAISEPATVISSTVSLNREEFEVVYTSLGWLAALLDNIIPSRLVQISPKGLSKPLHLGTQKSWVGTVTVSLTVVSGIVNFLTPEKLPSSLQYPHGVIGLVEL
mgnify:CR=1 FL=1